MSTPLPERPRSVRSVASNSSITSGVSLTRRSRTRTRSRTVTGTVPTQVLDTLLLPPRSVNVATSSRSLTSQEADSAAGEVTLVAGLPQPSPMPPKISKAAKQASQLASIETSYNPALSAFSRDPELTPNIRDSFSTQKSSTSSSFYPPSTSTLSGPESPASPRTAAEEPLQQPNIALLTEDFEEMQGYDGDDVAYRLRLLVNNSYFLPPAHMKPSPQDFAASMNAKKPQKPSAPTFLDIFRVGKSKSKPTTPVAPTFGNGPMLRTTSDSIAAPFALRNQSRAPQPPHISAHPANGSVDRGRVVVVRERMSNIAVAAKQAEQEMKTRNARRDQGTERARQQSPITPQTPEFGDVVDPTDAVDIPLPASNYPFAVQASALHGLGVHESLGAAILADRLPPNSPGSPGMSSVYGVDDHWRKALLQEAVHHSLDNTPDESMFSYLPGTSTPMLATPRVNGELSRRSPRLSALGNRLSYSSYSQGCVSPTTSAFQDALNHTGQQSSTSSMHRSSFDEPIEPETRTRSSLASPPPRPSTSVAHIALQPPPRSSSFNYPPSALGRHASGSEPQIETQPNAMDDLESSDEDSGDEDDEATDVITRAPPPHSPPSPFIVDPRARANSTVSAQAQAQAQSSNLGPLAESPGQSVTSSPSSVFTAPKALKKLDGMLVQHMEAEKDRIRKIAGAIKSSSQVNLPGTLGGPRSPS
ncbi:hypothetical protein AN958_12583 [Leucoagaricus sp. SymC.cos]|nr:hypothetical protein AN958_12583 [Leucoagaricus sp. SymC.cos]